jgi:hypothetical protein
MMHNLNLYLNKKNPNESIPSSDVKLVMIQSASEISLQKTFSLCLADGVQALELIMTWWKGLLQQLHSMCM